MKKKIKTISVNFRLPEDLLDVLNKYAKMKRLDKTTIIKLHLIEIAEMNNLLLPNKIIENRRLVERRSNNSKIEKNRRKKPRRLRDQIIKQYKED
jgi:hypothetical protein